MCSFKWWILVLPSPANQNDWQVKASDTRINLIPTASINRISKSGSQRPAPSACSSVHAKTLSPNCQSISAAVAAVAHQTPGSTCGECLSPQGSLLGRGALLWVASPQIKFVLAWRTLRRCLHPEKNNPPLRFPFEI